MTRWSPIPIPSILLGPCSPRTKLQSLQARDKDLAEAIAKRRLGLLHQAMTRGTSVEHSFEEDLNKSDYVVISI